ncbi:Hypothetical protein CINCED_3A018899 [Cinara cedri]|nr:Hypothetical protein CINCED_3A018899 [Cinara cedri]
MVAVSKQQQPKQVLTEKQPKPQKIKMPEVQKQKEQTKPVEKNSGDEPGVDPVKRCRNLKKKLKNIEELEIKVAEGHSIDNDQRKKISSKNAVIKDITNLEAIIKVLYPEPPKPSKKDGKKDAKKDGKKEANKKETKKENKPIKVNEKKPSTVLTNGTPVKKAEKKPVASPVQENGTTANKKTDKGTKTEVKIKAQPKTQTQTKTQAQTKPKAPPVVEISIEAAKRIRNLKKKLKTIDELELKVAEGGKIDKDQRVKISKKSKVLAEIIALESGK